jgi:electron transport complex protein RnfC
VLGADRVMVGIEDNKPEAVAAMRVATKNTALAMEVVAVPTVYPGGGAKQLIRVLTGIEVPASGRSAEFGVQCFNTGTAFAVHRALNHGEPVVSRIVTITGNVDEARNYDALIGTPVKALLSQAGERADTDGHIMGGPMMGFSLPSVHVPVIKSTNCIIAASKSLFPAKGAEMPCIRCTRCADVCPADLQPQELFWFAKAKDLGKAQKYGLFDCIECGCCSYVCPSDIPLVQYYRFAKSEIWANEREKAAADLARERHEFHQARLERAQAEKAERLAAKQVAAKHAPAADTGGSAPEQTIDPKKAAINAAIERAKAKKAQIAPKNVDNLTPEQLAEIAEIEARRAKIAEMARQGGPTQH